MEHDKVTLGIYRQTQMGCILYLLMSGVIARDAHHEDCYVPFSYTIFVKTTFKH